ncbi:MAG: helix-turn-helix transcriptional regulator [Acetatifactor sp.]|nr:helix-turn-helix transcriptional regulator [Acetatifactor sp.]
MQACEEWRLDKKIMGKEGESMVCAKVNQIIAAMTASCMSPQEIADKAGVSVNIVYRMRRGYLVKMDRFGKVCQVLGIAPEDVIDYDRLEQREKGGAKS